MRPGLKNMAKNACIFLAHWERLREEKSIPGIVGLPSGNTDEGGNISASGGKIVNTSGGGHDGDGNVVDVILSLQNETY